MARFFLLLAGVLAGCAAQAPPRAVTIAELPAPPPTTCVPPIERAARPPELPAGYLKMSVAGVVQQGDGAAVGLLDPKQATVVPIFVGGTEAVSIQERFAHSRFPRPLTHDLFDAALEKLHVRVFRAQVDKLEDGTYFGTLVLEGKWRYYELDARPSDAIALALGSDAPIYCAADVVANEGVPRERFDALGTQQSAGATTGAGGASGGTSGPIYECVLAKALKQAGRPEWKRAAALCKARGGTP
jgi:bifunctional DNase/RNase